SAVRQKGYRVQSRRWIAPEGGPDGRRTPPSPPPPLRRCTPGACASPAAAAAGALSFA
ncbi:hypothetical protein P7K49_024658, partial [Saguinus oedipus]